MKLLPANTFSTTVFLTVGHYTRFDLWILGELRALPLQNRFDKDFSGSRSSDYVFATALEDPKYLDLSVCRGKKVSVEIKDLFKTAEKLLKIVKAWSIEVLKYQPKSLVVLGCTELKKYVFTVSQNGAFKTSQFDNPTEWKKENEQQ